MRKTIVTFILAGMLVFSGCAPRSDETTPEMAQSMLKVRGYNYSDKGIFEAIRQNDAQAVTLFMQGGTDPNVRNDDGETPLTYAVRNSMLPVVKAIAAKADVNLSDGNGNSPLFVALKNEKYEIFEYLMENKADVNAAGTAGATKDQNILYVAVMRDRPDLIETLLKKGADPNRGDSEGALPLNEAVLRSRPNMEIVNLLIKGGADINKPEMNGATTIMYVASNDKLSSSTRQELVKMLLEKGADKTVTGLPPPLLL